MNRHSRQLDGSRPRRQSPAGNPAASSVLVALCVLASALPARGSDETPRGPERGVAPNQSVDLTDGDRRPSTDSAAIGKNTRGADGISSPDESAGTQSAPGVGGAETVPRRGGQSAIQLRRGISGPGRLGSGLGALAIVLGVVAIAYWVIRRWVPSVRGAEGGVMKVAGRISLGPKHHAALVFLGRRCLLVGIAPEGVSTLCEVTDPAEVAELMSRTGVSTVKGGGASGVFEEQLLREVGEYDVDPTETPDLSDQRRATTAGGNGPMSDLLRKLRRMRSA